MSNNVNTLLSVELVHLDIPDDWTADVQQVKVGQGDAKFSVKVYINGVIRTYTGTITDLQGEQGPAKDDERRMATLLHNAVAGEMVHLGEVLAWLQAEASGNGDMDIERGAGLLTQSFHEQFDYYPEENENA